MAGSYRHVTEADGSYRGVELLDHLGDASEAIEEMWHMIQWLTGGDRQRIYLAWREGYVRRQLAHRLAEEPKLFTQERFWYADD